MPRTLKGDQQAITPSRKSTQARTALLAPCTAPRSRRSPALLCGGSTAHAREALHIQPAGGSRGKVAPHPVTMALRLLLRPLMHSTAAHACAHRGGCRHGREPESQQNPEGRACTPSSADVSLVEAGSRSARSRAAPSALPSRRNSCVKPHKPALSMRLRPGKGGRDCVSAAAPRPHRPKEPFHIRPHAGCLQCRRLAAWAGSVPASARP